MREGRGGWVGGLEERGERLMGRWGRGEVEEGKGGEGWRRKGGLRCGAWAELTEAGGRWGSA